MTNQLPDKPSELLALALADLAKVEKSLRYEVCMEYWHLPTEDGVCQVSMAGALMAKTLKVDRFKEFKPSDFETDTKNNLLAIEYFRMGFLGLALKIFGIGSRRYPGVMIDVAYYHTHRKRFKKDMRDIIKMLEREDL